MNASSSVVMVHIAGAYYKLGHYAEVESIAAKTKASLEAAGLIKCYVFAQCKRRIVIVQLSTT